MFSRTLITLSLTFSFLFLLNIDTAMAQIKQAVGNGLANTTTSDDDDDDDDGPQYCCIGSCDRCISGSGGSISCEINDGILTAEDLLNEPTIDAVLIPELSPAVPGQGPSWTMETASNCSGCSQLDVQLPSYPAWVQTITVIVITTDDEYSFELDLP